MKSFTAATLAVAAAASSTTLTGTGSAATGISSVTRSLTPSLSNMNNLNYLEFEFTQKVTMAAAMASGDEAESLFCLQLQGNLYHCLISSVAMTSTYVMKNSLFKVSQDGPIQTRSFTPDTSFLTYFGTSTTKTWEGVSAATAAGTVVSSPTSYTTTSDAQSSGYVWKTTGN